MGKGEGEKKYRNIRRCIKVQESTSIRFKDGRAVVCACATNSCSFLNDADDAFIPAARQWRDNSCYNVRGNLTSKPLSNMYHRVILLVLLAAPYANSLISLSDVGDIISFTHEVVIDVLQAWKLVSPLLEGEGPEHIDLPIIKNKEKKLLSKIAQVNRRYFFKSTLM